MRNEESGCKPLFQGISNVQKTMTELKNPCPLCGKKAKIVGYSYCPYITCENKHEFTPRYPRDIDDLINTWELRKEPKRMCANCKHCSEPGVRSDVVCFLTNDSREYYDVCENWDYPDD